MAVDLSELEKRLEQATEGSGDLDQTVFRACGFKVYPFDPPGRDTMAGVAPVTSSLSDAVALIEKRMPTSDLDIDSTIMEAGNRRWRVTLWSDNNRRMRDENIADADTGPLALCLALIRALRHPR